MTIEHALDQHLVQLVCSFESMLEVFIRDIDKVSSVEDGFIQHRVVHHAKPHIVQITECYGWKQHFVDVLSAYGCHDRITQILDGAPVHLVSAVSQRQTCGEEPDEPSEWLTSICHVTHTVER